MPSLTSMYFAAVVSGAAFFGVYAILTFTALYLLSRRERTVTTMVMMILTVVMFGISATYFALDVFLVSDGILHPDKYPHVIDRHGREAAAQIICQAINFILGDGIVIWRAWVVWGRRLPVVIVPLILLIGVAFSSLGMAYAQIRAAHDPKCATMLRNFVIALPCLTLATNVAASFLVLLRIFVLHSTMRKAERLDRFTSIMGQGGVRYHRLLKILIESGGMYCLTWLIQLCLVVTHSPAERVVISIISQLTGIYPTLIIVLVSLNLTQERVQGPVIDTGIKFHSTVAPDTTFSRTVSFTLGHTADSSGVANGDDVENGGAFVTRAELGCTVDATKAPGRESQPYLKGCVAHHRDIPSVS